MTDITNPTPTTNTETLEFSSNIPTESTESTESTEPIEPTESSEPTVQAGNIKQNQIKKKKHKKKKKNRCFFEGCNKKLSTIDKLMTCKCSHNYCKQHVSITNHNCKANFLALNKEYLIKNNPVVMPSKFTAL